MCSRRVDGVPQPLGHEEGEDDGDRTEADEVPRALVGELVLDREEDDGAEDRALEGAEAADEHHEDHVGGVLHAEDRLGLDEQRVREDQRPGRAAAEAGQHEEHEPQRSHANAERRRRLLVVAQGLQCRAGLAAEQQEQQPEEQDDEAQRHPVDVGMAHRGVVDVEPAQRDAGATAQPLVEDDEQCEGLGHHPGPDGELAAAQPQHEQRDERRQHGRGERRPARWRGSGETLCWVSQIVA